ncbi:uncharacterized protein [Antedon mediterranea]|uniref:uncharacterized protein n=1 Tax=Antedon mediterranea TaxID=105859 RepID=UPI003AF54F0A
MRFSLWICYILVAFIDVKCQDYQGCICDSLGTINVANCTNETVVCACVHGYSGEFCHLCDSDFFQVNSSEACQPCDCHANGVVNNTCDSDGVCSCHGNWIGNKCDACVDGYYYLNDTCVECQCSGQACNKTTGVCICQEPTVGDRCESCLPGYYKVNDLCTLCNTSSPSSLCADVSTVQPITSDTLPMSHDSNTPITKRRSTSINFETTEHVHSPIKTTMSSDPNTEPSNGPLTSTHPVETVVGSTESVTEQSRILPTKSSSKGSVGVVVGVTLTLSIVFVTIVALIVYNFWVKPRRRIFRSPLWTIELRRDEDDTLFNDLQTIDQDVLYLDDAYLMDSARVYNKVTTENSRYHPLG